MGPFCVNLLCSRVLKDVSRCRLFLVGNRPLISAVFPAEVEWCLFFRLNKEEFMGTRVLWSLMKSLDDKKRSFPTFSAERHLLGWALLKQGGDNLVLELLWSIFCKLLSLELKKGTPVSPLQERLLGSHQCNYRGQSNTQHLGENAKQGRLVV